ncbi:MAG: hypothetical protein A2Y88_02885 [Chloroflexi bacterium RBG_13_48_10]|nr:MAG: hypothetical protein A2Y88_02885 [Chloroflexi bacterium RBG_13_48_10]
MSLQRSIIIYFNIMGLIQFADPLILLKSCQSIQEHIEYYTRITGYVIFIFTGKFLPDKPNSLRVTEILIR